MSKHWADVAALVEAGGTVVPPEQSPVFVFKIDAYSFVIGALVECVQS